MDPMDPDDHQAAGRRDSERETDGKVSGRMQAVGARLARRDGTPQRLHVPPDGRKTSLRMMLYFPLVTCWCEFVLKFMSFGLLPVRWNQWGMTAAFSLFYGSIIYWIYAWLRSPRMRTAYVYLVHAFFLLIFSVQTIYYRTFRVFTPLASIDQGGSGIVNHFLGQALVAFFKGIPVILLLLLPALSWRHKLMKKFLSRRASPAERRYSGLAAILLALLLSVLMHLQDGRMLPPSLFYYHRFIPQLSVREFGLITTMRIDFMQNVYALINPPKKDDARLKGVADILKRELSYEHAPKEEKAGFRIFDGTPFTPSPVIQREDADALAIAVSSFRKTAREAYTEEASASIGAHKPRDLSATERINPAPAPEQADASVLEPMHFYFATQEPRVEHRYTGLLKGRNLIWIMAESHADYAIDPELTPTLYRMQQEGLRVPRYYNPLWGVSTTDGEYSQLLSQFPIPGQWSMLATRYNRLDSSPGWSFAAAGYRNIAWHNHEWTYYQRPVTHTHLGFDYDGLGGTLDLSKHFPASDAEMVQKTIAESSKETPFFIYYLTMSGHMMYETKYNDMASRHIEQVAAAERELWTDEAEAYIAANLEVEFAVRELIDFLANEDLLKDTVIVITNDHYPYGLSDPSVASLVGESEDSFAAYRGTFILWTPDLPEMDMPVVTKYAAGVDVAPTIMNLFGLPYDARLLAGRDLLGPAPGEVIYQDYSWQSLFGTFNAFTEEYEAAPPVRRAAYEWASRELGREEEIHEAVTRNEESGEAERDEAVREKMEAFEQELVRQENARIDLRFVMSHMFLDSDYERVLLEGEERSRAYHAEMAEAEATAASAAQ